MNDNIIQEFVESIREPQVDNTTTYSAIVSKVDNEGIVWVNLTGSDIETPTASSSSEVKRGDVVYVQWRNNKLYIMGNDSNPSAGIGRVRDAEIAANTAKQAANNAVQDASRAREAAEAVEGIARHAEEVAEGVEAIAGEAKTAADTAFTNLSQVQSVLEVAEWIATHGTYVKATTFNPNATYYTVTATQVASPSDDDKDSQGVLIYYEESSGVYIRTTDTRVQSGKTYYTVTGTPVAGAKAEDIGQYYTLAVTEAMANYIKSHLALTDDGLYVMKDGSQWKVRVADDGVYILDPNNKPTNQMIGTGNVIGHEDETHAEIDYHSLKLLDREGNTYFHVSDLRANHTVQEKYGEGYYHVHTETHIVPSGYQKSFELIGEVWNNKCTVKVDDVETTAFSVQSNKIIFDDWLSGGKTVTVEYASQSPKFKAYTLGARNGAVGVYSVAEGNNTTASGEYTHAEGESTEAIGKYSHAEGYNTTSSGEGSHAEGRTTEAKGEYSHAEGFATETRGKYSHAEGYRTETKEWNAHAEGYETRAHGSNSHAEGASTFAEAAGSHAEGGSSYASALYSHAEGYDTLAKGNSAHAEGYKTKAKGYYSHTQNKETIAEYEAQTAIGKYNSNDSNNAFEIGNGTDEEHRSNAFAVDWDGNVYAQGMAGMIQMFAGATAPNGWLICDGQAVSRTTYDTLFAVIGTTYGAGDGSTTFNLPDMRDRFPVGAGSSYALNDKGGANTVTLTTNQMPSHTHRLLMRYSAGTSSGYPVEPSSGQQKQTWSTGRVENIGGGQAHENRPPYIGINFVICTGK